MARVKKYSLPATALPKKTSSYHLWASGSEAVSPNKGRPTLKFTPDPKDTVVGYAGFDFNAWNEYGSKKTNRSQCRKLMCPIFKACNGNFVTNRGNPDWDDENPDDWYPMDMRFTCVVVAAGTTFSGWGTYIESERTPLALENESKPRFTSLSIHHATMMHLTGMQGNSSAHSEAFRHLCIGYTIQGRMISEKLNTIRHALTVGKID